MDKNPRFFIYSRWEALALILLAVMVAAFAFTLGVHLGSRVIQKGVAHPSGTVSGVSGAPEAVPSIAASSRPEPGGKGPSAMNDALDQSLHDEVARTGIKLDQSHQVNLPENAKSKNAGATTPESTAPDAEKKPSAPASPAQNEEPPAHAEAATGHYSLQIGSFGSAAEARERVNRLHLKGQLARMESAEVKGKGTRYRVFVGSYATHAQANAAGDELRRRHLIGSFIVASAKAAEQE